MSGKIRQYPYADRGKRLRARKESLIELGTLPADLRKIAKLAGVSVSGFQQWERGETWPRKLKRARLAEFLGWSEQELDYGPQPEAEGQSDMSSHPVSPDELEILALYRGLEDQKVEVKRFLLAKLHTRHALKQNMRGPLMAVKDTEVERKMPVTTAHQLPQKSKPKR